jgi:methionine synthase II (cobalamin-independent)
VTGVTAEPALPTGVATGVGSMPGEDLAAALRLVLDELTDLPHLPELPARSAAASATGRAVAMLADLGADLQPAGWRLTDAPGRDHRRARSLLAQDLDVLEEQTQGYTGAFKVQATGPWTLAATVERPRGDRLLADHGARRELAQSLAEGLAAHVEEVRRRVPGARVVAQVDEPGLPAVLAGSVPTASGFHRHRSVGVAEGVDGLRTVLDAAADAGAAPVVHCCAETVPVEVLTRAGARAVSVDMARISRGRYDDYARLLDQGVGLWLGVVPSTDPDPAPRDADLVQRVQRLLDDLGFDPDEAGPRVVVTPTCGLAGATTGWARRALVLAGHVARHLSASRGRMGA